MHCLICGKTGLSVTDPFHNEPENTEHGLEDWLYCQSIWGDSISFLAKEMESIYVLKSARKKSTRTRTKLTSRKKSTRTRTKPIARKPN